MEMLIKKLSGGALSGIIILALLAFFGLIVLIIVLVKKKVGFLQIQKDEKKTEEEIAKEELDRILVPIEDENIQKAMLDNELKEENKNEQK